jgi:hypothetical protein
MKQKNEEDISRKAVTAKEAALMYGFKEGTLANMRSQKVGPKFYKVGRKKVLYFTEDLDIWARANPVLTKDCLPER